jgi:hypothetical protein
MTVRELLSGCRTAVIEIAAIERQIEKVLPTGGPKQYNGAWPTVAKVKGEECYAFAGRGTNDTEAARQQQVDGLMEMLRTKQSALEQMLVDFERLIEQLDDGTARTILRYYYVVAWTDERIADELELPRQSVNARRNAAVGYLESVA